MSVAVRLKRIGRKKHAQYRVVVIDSRNRRDGRPIEDIGYFDPHADVIDIDLARFNYLVSVGAQPSDRVNSITKKVAQ